MLSANDRQIVDCLLRLRKPAEIGIRTGIAGSGISGHGKKRRSPGEWIVARNSRHSQLLQPIPLSSVLRITVPMKAHESHIQFIDYGRAEDVVVAQHRLEIAVALNSVEPGEDPALPRAA